MRLVTDLVRGKKVNEALAMLRYTQNKAALDVSQTLYSAVSNLIHKDEYGHNPGKVDSDTGNVIIKSIQVDQGPVLKRVLPAPQGRAFRIRKRMCHLTIVVGTK
jgi:large subunit ribosomal protein L22